MRMNEKEADKDRIIKSTERCESSINLHNLIIQFGKGSTTTTRNKQIPYVFA